MSQKDSIFSQIAEADSKEEVIRESGAVLKQLEGKLNEMVELDEYQSKYVDNKDVGNYEEDVIRSLKGAMRMCENGLEIDQFKDFAQFHIFLVRLTNEIMNAVNNELRLEEALIDTGAEVNDETEEIIVRIFNAEMEVLDEIKRLAESIIVFEKNNDEVIDSSITKPSYMNSDDHYLEEIMEQVEGRKETLKDWAESRDIEL